MICPVCKKEISRPLHITKSKDEAHILYIEDQKELAKNLLYTGTPLTDILNDERIFMKSMISDYIYNYHKQKMLEVNRPIRNKRISNSNKKEDSLKSKMKKKMDEIIQHGEENIDYVTCKLCGLKSSNISSHVTRIHELSAREYKINFPNSQLFSLKMRESFKRKMLENNPNNNPQNIEKMVKTIKKKQQEGDYKSNRFIGGFREDIGHYARSSWEANFARILLYQGINYEYEKKIFHFFDNNQKLICSYLPDFYLTKNNVWIEIKGWMDKESKMKIELFKKYYPNERLFVIDKYNYHKMYASFGNKLILEDEKINIRTHPHLFGGIEK